ncbi:hypothetical protein GA0111570_10536 [Raineyella antarctica]|uniref:CAAX protease self-immunity n=1 Tax=Raineyella antarctica TaxID=1577474 RepID=A0A1G6GTC6_9ACTN|nr:hypothetical protein [Raineyella antarctica]SDB85270.1 hypothetical protein GA0111570_10536 [Raineyella antarctica]
MTGPAAAGRRQAWAVVGVLALPVAVVVALEQVLVGWALRDAGLLSASTLAPALGVGLVLALRRRLPGLRTQFDAHVDARVLRRGLVALLLVIGLLVAWNQLCLLLGWLSVPRIDPDAGLPFIARLGLYLPLAVAQESAWRGIVRPTLRATYGWIAAAVGTGLVWGLLTASTWRFGPGLGILAVVTTIGWSVLLASVLEEMRHGQLVVASLFQWGLMVALYLLLPEETGAWHGAVVLATTGVLAGAGAIWAYARSREGRGMAPYG